jgi:transcriptional regulator with PAS, ATPase and Fis domain
VHHYTGRSGPFIGVNCATIPEQLAEAQLFGHRRGAFTGATSSEEGYFRAAQGGTLFLDEVVELPLGVQAKLLRVLQEREYCPVGETRTVRSDVRLVAAAQLPLDHYVRRGTLRQDLATRLEGYEVILPELSARREDIPYLFLKFLRDDLGEQTPKLHARAVEALCLYPWPGNVRELQHVAKQMAVLRRGEPELRLEHLPERVTDLRGEVDEASSVDAPQPSASSGALVKDADQLALLGQALFEHAGNVQRAAQQLGISRGRAYRLIAQGRLDIAKIRGT